MRWQTIVACVVMTFVSVFVFGLPSAKEITRPAFQTSSLRSRFAANQLAVSCVLLILTGVFAARGIMAASFDLRFDYRNVILVDPQFHLKEGSPDNLRLNLDSLSARFSALPAVESVSVATGAPLYRRPDNTNMGFPRVYRSAVAPSFFEVMGLSLVHGRTFLPGEQDAVIANETAARSLWPNQNPLGQLWNVAGDKRRVVGVVQDSGEDDLDTANLYAYLPMSSPDSERALLIIRTGGALESVVSALPRAAAELDESVAVIPMRSRVESRRRGDHTLTMVFGSIGLVATALAGAGMFALIAFTVMQRTREIGIRIAIGATRRDLLFGLIGIHSKPLAGGLLKGTVGGLMLLLFVRVFWYPVPYVLLVGGFVLGLLSFLAFLALATLIPTLRALRIDPATALRSE
jgi:ABC-type antimicrobial peptide transport system permease subunit